MGVGGVSNKINIEGSFAPTETELVETTKYLIDLVDSWPDDAKNAKSRAVERFTNKLDRLVAWHGLAAAGEGNDESRQSG